MQKLYCMMHSNNKLSTSCVYLSKRVAINKIVVSSNRHDETKTIFDFLRWQKQIDVNIVLMIMYKKTYQIAKYNNWHWFDLNCESIKSFDCDCSKMSRWKCCSSFKSTNESRIECFMIRMKQCFLSN